MDPERSNGTSRATANPGSDRTFRHDSKERKLRAILGLAAGTTELVSSRLSDPLYYDTRVDLRSWLRYAIPEFALVLNTDENQVVGVIDTDTGECIMFDIERCHPSDASLLLSGVNNVRIASLVEAINTIANASFDGERLASVRTLTRKIIRVIGVGT